MPLSRSSTSHPFRRGRAAVITIGAVVALLAALLGPGSQAGSLATLDGSADNRVTTEKPNFVLVVVDDLSQEIIDYMPAVQDMLDEATIFDNFFVSTAQCCPSRSSILTGRFPQNTNVLTNQFSGQPGGFGEYANEVGTDLGAALQVEGYRTGFIGKYLNEYNPAGHQGDGPRPNYEEAFVPAGWDEWWATGGAYKEFDYDVVRSIESTTAICTDPDEQTCPDGYTEMPGVIGDVHARGHDPNDYFTDHMAVRATNFLHRTWLKDDPEDPNDSAPPFALVLTPFAVHSGNDPFQGTDFPAAPRDRPECGETCPPGWEGLAEWEQGDCGFASDTGCSTVPFPHPRWAGTYEYVDPDCQTCPPPPVWQNPPDWVKPPNHNPPTEQNMENARARHIERLQMAQSVSDLIVEVRGALDEYGFADNTYVIFTSDNGYHLWQHRLPNGKNTPYDHDMQVPLLVVPPDSPGSYHVEEIAQNTDLTPTILDLAGATPIAEPDGLSLAPFIWTSGSQPTPPAGWRQGGLLTYVEDDQTSQNPDFELAEAHLPSYAAIRTEDYLYVDYDPYDDDPPSGAGDGEFYQLDSDAAQMNNRFDELEAEQPTQLEALHDLLMRYFVCTPVPVNPLIDQCQEVATAAYPVIDLDEPPESAARR